MDPKARFTDRVEDYLLARPGYPPSVLETLAELTGLEKAWSVADIGSGTGLATQLFLGHGNRVFAVEPNDAMRQAAEQRLGAVPGFVSVNGSAEDSRLGPGTIDLVVAAQAFHWFDWNAARLEFRRVLKPPGWVAVIWNARVVDASAFMKSYESLVEAYRTHRGSRHDRTPDLLAIFFEAGHAHRVLENHQDLDFDGLRARLLSSSYAPKAGDPRHEEMIAALHSLFAAHQQGGFVRFPYQTEVFAGQVLANKETHGA